MFLNQSLKRNKMLLGLVVNKLILSELIDTLLLKPKTRFHNTMKDALRDTLEKVLEREYMNDEPPDVFSVKTLIIRQIKFIGFNVEYFDSDKINLLKKIFITYADDYTINFAMSYIVDYIEPILLVEFIQIHIDILTKILDNAPPIDRCIKLYKIIGRNDELYEVGKIYTQKVMNSMTCSRTSNISIFYNRDKQPCCLLEVNCKKGTKVLFLNYLKTAYGANMFEVILPIGYDFKVVASEIKDIITFNFDATVKQPKTKEIQPIRDLIYKEPQIKKIKVYEIIIV